MSVLNLIGSIFKPAVKLIDELHTSEEEKLKQKAATLGTYAEALELGLEFETKQLEARARIVEAEARSESFLTANWRPITMLTFLALVVLDSFGLLVTPLAAEAWTLLQLGLGGYVVGRSVEKAAIPVIDALKKKDQT